MKGTLKAGLEAGLKTTWTLGKVIFPVTLIVSLLQHTPVMDWMIKMITPAMGVFGLSGEAAIPLVLGNTLNLYAGIAGILTLDLTVKEVFILAVMLSFCHNLIIESTVASRVGIKIGIILLVRIGLAGFSAVIINLVWHGGQDAAKYGLISAKSAAPSGWCLKLPLKLLQKRGWGYFSLPSS